ncbi:50S ribosomal protein L21 [Mycoplasma anserisalpingitidis]|uniref:Large ribosomal subunit protein bL21 n=1 Tax=Mycoplasma anserisalpingitidis TaxID=519450 RepID=A0A5B8JXQ9_9MOLU|nr:50S ribosomal protein L21 [Mycoplasma anserisalpingitidis]QDY87060.1 50S ribosomal protein L21 [Mycoplasma anserisalpingitidis]QDY87674.1 50S ribosomal protein L21 [Mycoplasma anserisalpingitidis]QDY88724.1 50S ribosomal protein L21 [Mycoplasma anserisalpingitidis]UCU26610.1 50S ribosomal protein L21 [Mycoplasma anserisalpingitidis]UCU27448.1 50S ribosomal protein L21 [Mycoplasma anserisalpingitidis]
MKAIIETGGKQLLVEVDQTIFIEKIEGNEGDNVTFDKVLLVDSKIGQPYLTGASVTGVIEKQGKAKKIVVYRHNAKSTHKRKLGHRQPYTRVKITEIKG